MWWVTDMTAGVKFPFSTELDARTAAKMVPEHDIIVWEWNPLAEDEDEDED